MIQSPRRRAWLAAAAAVPWLAPGIGLNGCTREAVTAAPSRWVGAQHERGHRLREAAPADTSAMAGNAPVQRRAAVLVIGAGIAGLAAARALARQGVDDVHLLELEDGAGGNSRRHAMGGGGIAGDAHYLPVPGEHALEVIELLEELGLRRRQLGRVVYDERHLCHSPQERLHIEGQWVEGLLPPVEALPAGERAATLAQYRRFGAEVAQVSHLAKGAAFVLPTARAAWGASLAALDVLTFAQWLDQHRFDAAPLRWYLDYCCRDDFGAGAARVSAWAGLHYFASRHGFHAPGDESGERDEVLTWPEGNGWLAARLAAPLQERMHGGCVVQRVSETRHAVNVELWNGAAQRHERWAASQVVLAVPLFIAARLLESPPDALVAAAAQMQYAPWLVSNLQLDAPLSDRAGAAPAWDNVLYGSDALGYVDAMHQSTRPYAGPTVLTAYWALGGDSAQQAQTHRRRLLDDSAAAWSAAVLADLARAHPDLPSRVTQIDLMRYGHAMSIPVPGVRSSTALRALQQTTGRVHFAHSDLSAYSVFEEAMYQGTRAATGVLRGQRGAVKLASALRSRPLPPARHG